MKKTMYIIAGCNGAGKTTASFTILPTILNCKEFVNADEIARGISPFQPEKVGIESGRIMLNRINELLEENQSFAFETTLASKIYRNKIRVRFSGEGLQCNLALSFGSRMFTLLSSGLNFGSEKADMESKRK